MRGGSRHATAAFWNSQTDLRARRFYQRPAKKSVLKCTLKGLQRTLLLSPSCPSVFLCVLRGEGLLVGLFYFCSTLPSPGGFSPVSASAVTKIGSISVGKDLRLSNALRTSGRITLKVASIFLAPL